MKEIASYIEESIGLEHVLHTVRDQLVFESMREQKEKKQKAIEMMKVCNPDSRKAYREIIQKANMNIKKFKFLEKQNNESKLITRMFRTVNKDVPVRYMEDFKERSHDMLHQFTSLLIDAYKLNKEPNMKAALLIEKDGRGYKYKGKDYIIVVK